jgi:hypothetical protein
MANDLTKEVLDELERLDREATPRPWVWGKRDVDGTVHPKRGWMIVMDFVRLLSERTVGNDRTKANRPATCARIPRRRSAS